MDPTDRSQPIVKSITTLYKMVVHQDGRISVAQHGVLQCVAVCCSVLQCMLYIKMGASLLHNMAMEWLQLVNS